VDRSTRVRLFSGKACRIVRFLLQHPGRKLKAQEVASGTQTSYAFTHGVLTKLEREGLVARDSRPGLQAASGPPVA
jgi:DNA-binding IclR family transcriptional regulator